MKPRKWADERTDELTIENIARLYAPAEEFRISKYEYPIGTTFLGQMRPGICFVIQGTCEYKFDESVILRAGEMVELPGGSYEFSVHGDANTTIVHVWSIPQS